MIQLPAHPSDHIADLLDRHGCLHTLVAHWDEHARTGIQLAVIWLNIDRFKQINDSFGHRVGDQVLGILAARVAEALAGRGQVARVGGDEFAVILPNCPRVAGERLARALLSAVGQPLAVDGVRVRPSASLGLGLANPGESPHDLLERTERAMHLAKRQGGAQYCLSVAPEPSHEQEKRQARNELAMEETLHRALETGGLFLNYQPILHADGSGIEALEALMRCHVDGEVIPPGRFIPVAEKTGLIIRLGEWCLLAASRYVSQLNAEGRQLKVAVNVSRAQLTAPKFSQALHAALACSDMSPALLELEITESLFMDASDVVQRNLRAALDAGFPLSIDDFGTGYSCLATLKDLPASKLKLDRAFILDLPQDRRSFAVVKSMTRLALDLGMKVVAEGVETVEQYDALREAGVTAIQGFYLARPMAEQHLETWLEKRNDNE